MLHMVKNIISADNFGSLLELQNMNGVQFLKAGEIYTHYSFVAQMLKYFVDIRKEEIKEKVEKSDFVV